MQVINFTSPNPYLNLATEEYMLTHHAKDKAQIYLMFYENSDSIILGRTLKEKHEIFTAKKHPLVLRRLSGGGTVLHFYGNLVFSLLINFETYPEYYSIRNSYSKILEPMLAALSSKTKIAQKGISDISLMQGETFRKISGNAQARKKGWLLHHGTIVYNSTQAKKISYYLRLPPVIPDYRNERSHRDFMFRGNFTLRCSELKRKIIKAYSKHFDTDSQWNEASSFFSQADVCIIRNEILPNYVRD